MSVLHTFDRILDYYRSSTTHRLRQYLGPSPEAAYDSRSGYLAQVYDSGIERSAFQYRSVGYAPPSQEVHFTIHRYNAAGGPSDV
jgi:hypothetical protein